MALGLTQEDLAEHVRVSVETIRNIEKGRKWVTTRTVTRCAKALKVPEVDLFENHDKSGSFREPRQEKLDSSRSPGLSAPFKNSAGYSRRFG